MFGKRKRGRVSSDVLALAKTCGEKEAQILHGLAEVRATAERALALAEDPQTQIDQAKAKAQAEADERRGKTGYAR